MSHTIDNLMKRREECYRTTAGTIYDTDEKRMDGVLRDFEKMFSLEKI